ncbi:MAG: tetratricopeptide repeat protein [Muribaculaceae bacterium]|nr:tetratricopeptide repeat protein [Muribaculaceae bacterium]
MDTQDFKYINNGERDMVRARVLYNEGRERWQRGDRAGAIAAYEESASLDPSGPGAVALDMTRDIMDFYDKNQFNP